MTPRKRNFAHPLFVDRIFSTGSAIRGAKRIEDLQKRKETIDQTMRAYHEYLAKRHEKEGKNWKRIRKEGQEAFVEFWSDYRAMQKFLKHHDHETHGWWKSSTGKKFENVKIELEDRFGSDQAKRLIESYRHSRRLRHHFRDGNPYFENDQEIMQVILENNGFIFNQLKRAGVKKKKWHEYYTTLFLELVESTRNFDPRKGASVKSYIRGNVKYAILALFKKGKSVKTFSADAPDKEGKKYEHFVSRELDPVERLEPSEAKKKVERLMKRLPAHERKIIELLHLKKIPPKEVAQQLGISLAKLQVYERKAMEAMRKME